MNITPFDGKTPDIHNSVFLAEDCRIVGEVEIGENSSVWFKTVVRGDQDRVIVGAGTSLQDGVVVHVSDGIRCVIGDYVTVGHNAVVHACTVGSFTLVGIGSVVLDEAIIGEGSVVAAGTVVTPRKEFPPRSLIRGIPGRLIREITEDEYQRNVELAETYIKLAAQHMQKRGD